MNLKFSGLADPEMPFIVNPTEHGHHDYLSIQELLESPDDHRSCGQLARLGATLETIGQMFTAAAKECVYGGGTYDDNGCRFEYVGGVNKPKGAVNTDRIRLEFPSEEYPHFINPTPVRDM